MNKKTLITIALILTALITIFLVSGKTKETRISEHDLVEKTKYIKNIFTRANLKTNTSQISIPLDEILSGGPKKDGIPALDNPEFVSSSSINENVLGLVVEGESEVKFYPYTILVWHEIVNDIIDGKNIAVTFCPLCGTGIVYETESDSFGVSGLLWQSNLLMYDRATESLWSQAEGHSVVGKRLGEELEIYPSQLMTFSKFEQVYKDKNKKILSSDTGHKRDYGFFPYGDYDENKDLYFPVKDNDFELHPKELLVVTKIGDFSLAFVREKILEGEVLEASVDGISYFIKNSDSKIIIYDKDGMEYPSYVSMYFSWKNHNIDGILVK